MSNKMSQERRRTQDYLIQYKKNDKYCYGNIIRILKINNNYYFIVEKFQNLNGKSFFNRKNYFKLNEAMSRFRDFLLK